MCLLGCVLLSTFWELFFEIVFGKNAFSEFSNRLYRFKFNFYELVVPDLLHEFELGVWKAIFVHLIRILYAFGQDTIFQLNSRYVLYFHKLVISLILIYI